MCRFEKISKIGGHESVCLNDSCCFVVVALIAVVMVLVVGLEETVVVVEALLGSCVLGVTSMGSCRRCI